MSGVVPRAPAQATSDDDLIPALARVDPVLADDNYVPCWRSEMVPVEGVVPGQRGDERPEHSWSAERCIRALVRHLDAWHGHEESFEAAWEVHQRRGSSHRYGKPLVPSLATLEKYARKSDLTLLDLCAEAVRRTGHEHEISELDRPRRD